MRIKTILIFLPVLILRILLLSAETTWAYSVDDTDPSPFRREDAIGGRESEYDRDTFLHRFTYRYHPAAARAWQKNRQGFRTTVGSVKSSESYVSMQAYKTVDFDIPAFFIYRFARDEDFDSRYDSNLIGLGGRIDDELTLSILSDVVAAKENLNAQIEIKKNFSENDYIRLGFVAADMKFNPKQNQARYASYPYTYFAQIAIHPEDTCGVTAFVNYNAPSRLALPSLNYKFASEQLQGGWSLWHQPTQQTEWFVSAKAERAYRQRDDISGAGAPRRHFSRRYGESTVQVTQKIDSDWDMWLGVRGLTLLEQDVALYNSERERTERRREYMAYGGVNWYVHTNALFWPGVYVNRVDNRLEYRGSAPRIQSDKGYFSKLALPVDFALSPYARMTFNVTLRLHRLVFGGMNFQAYFLF